MPEIAQAPLQSWGTPILTGPAGVGVGVAVGVVVAVGVGIAVPVAVGVGVSVGVFSPPPPPQAGNSKSSKLSTIKNRKRRFTIICGLLLFFYSRYLALTLLGSLGGETGYTSVGSFPV
jgi:hypothetical protein